MLTYNQILKISRLFQQAHHVLKNFGNGGEWDRVVHNQQPTYKYPLMWMDDLPSSLSDGAETYNFRVAFMAPVVTLKDRDSDLMSTNVNEVKSDMIQCSNDFISYWVNQTDDYEGLVLEKSVNRTTFEDVTDDKLAGCYIDITFRQAFDYNECSIPMGTPTSLPDTCAPVLIYENGILVQTVASGGTYSYVSGGTIDISINGTLAYNDQAVNVDIPVITQINGWAIGVWNGTQHVIEPANVTVNFNPYDSFDAGATGDIPVIDTLGSPVGTIGMLGVTIADTTVENTNATYAVSVTAEGALVLPDTSVEVFVDGVSQGVSPIVTLDPAAVINILWT